MKKLIPLLLMVSACSISYAESMKFITVLSSPVGTFNKLEAVDPAQPAKGNTVNFCTNIGTQGVVELKGTKPAALTTVSLANNTTLGKTDEGKFSLNNITLKQGGNITGGRLFGNTVTVNNAASGKADNLYGNTLTVAGAKTKTLNVNSGASKITAQHDGADMVWSNEYQSDTACGNTASCAKQYLLKEKCVPFYSPSWETASASDADTCDGDTSKEFTCTPGVAKTCVDVVIDPDSYEELGEADNLYGDECPGSDNDGKYVCDGSTTEHCLDVYDASVKGEWRTYNVHNSSNSLTLKCVANSIQQAGDGNWCSSTGGHLRGRPADDACAETVGSLADGEVFTCAVGSDSAQDLCDSYGWGTNHQVNADWLVCYYQPKQRQVHCGEKKKRTVHCC